MFEQSQHIINMEAGGRIALYRIRPSRPVGYPLIIAHGTLSNHKTVYDLGRYLADQGYDCWLLEWGGHGQSVPVKRRQDFETPAFFDLPAAVGIVLQKTRQSKLFWVAHSGGGILMLMHLARCLETQTQIAGLVTIGSQATDAAGWWPRRGGTAVLWAGTHLLGRTPRLLLPLSNESEPSLLLAQWAMWNLRSRWSGHDGFDYMANLIHITVPALMIAGGGDDIAPHTGCRKFFEAYGGRDKSWLLCDLTTGYSKGFTHGQLVRGRAAKAEIFPQIGSWITQRQSM